MICDHTPGHPGIVVVIDEDSNMNNSGGRQKLYSLAGLRVSSFIIGPNDMILNASSDRG
jgi:hypothetical protein